MTKQQIIIWKQCGKLTWAYAGNESDFPLLEFVDKAIVVNPSNAMKIIVQSKGREVFDNLDHGKTGNTRR